MNIDEHISRPAAELLYASGIAIPDPDHGLRCAHFAFQIFSTVWPVLGLNPEHQKMAVAAALLHEAGGTLSRRDQHRKTYDIVRHARLPGFSDRQLLITACAARYHGGPYPNIEHAGFGDMTAAEQWIVRRLAAIGRVAAALDASRLGMIERIEVSTNEKGIELTAHAKDIPAVESDSLREVEGSFQMLTQMRLMARISVNPDSR